MKCKIKELKDLTKKELNFEVKLIIAYDKKSKKVLGVIGW